MRFLKYILEAEKEEVDDFKLLKKNRKDLDPEEREKVMKAGCVWHNQFDKDGKRIATPAIWKSVGSDGKTKYVCNTHRAYQVRDTLDASMQTYDFIESTS